MKWGVFSGALWGLDTVILGIALTLLPFAYAPEASMASAFLHDAICALILLIYMGARGRLKRTAAALRTRSGKAIALGAILGGPFGMSGYLIAIHNIGPGYTAIISTFYPAVGTFLAYIFLKERMRPRQILALLIALGAIIVIGYSSTETIASGNALIGIVAALACVLGWGSEAVILAWGMRAEEVDEDSALQIRESTSALVYLVLVAPIAGVLGFSIHALPTLGTGVIALAALAGTASYFFYYTAIHAVGASRGMALNISYSAWAVIFAFFLIGTVPSLLQVICCVAILVGTVLAATPNWKELRASW